MIAVLASFWPLLIFWYIPRTFDGSEEPWGLAAILTAVFFLFYKNQNMQIKAGTKDACDSFGFFLSACGLVLYTASTFFSPHLLQAALMCLTLFGLARIFKPSQSNTGILALLFLSLPLIPSLNFYMGFPIRLLITEGAKLLLASCGLSCQRQGTILMLAGNSVSIDAPCSGVNMLWASAFLAALVMSYYSLNLARSAALAAACLTLTIAANTIRVGGLAYFHFKSASFSPQITQMEEGLHFWGGVSVFIFLALACALIAAALAGHFAKAKSDDKRVEADAKQNSDIRIKELTAFKTLTCLAVIAGFVPVFSGSGNSASKQVLRNDPGNEKQEINWPDQINGQKLITLQNLPDKSERSWQAAFPGTVRRFSDGKRSYLIRYLEKATRQVHPASDCFKCTGYKIETGPLLEIDGSMMSSFVAEKDGKRWKVMERVYDNRGNSWTDVSEWYWSAQLGKSEAPWWALVIAEPLPTGSGEDNDMGL